MVKTMGQARPVMRSIYTYIIYQQHFVLESFYLEKKKKKMEAFLDFVLISQFTS